METSAGHPYRAPGEAYDELGAVRRKLRPVGWMCLLTGAMWLVFMAVTVVVGVVGAAANGSGEDIVTGIVMVVFGGGYFFLLAVATFAGGYGLLRQPRWGYMAGWVAAAASFIGGSCGCVFAMLLAVWILVVLQDPEARRAFTEDGMRYAPPRA
ncbi:MAG: hypothetical protein AAGF12_06210 [Myxococcota bacterium]